MHGRRVNIQLEKYEDGATKKTHHIVAEFPNPHSDLHLHKH